MLPDRLYELSRDERLRLIPRIRPFHVPRQVEARLFESIDSMIREGYSYRDPESPATFADLSGEDVWYAKPKMPPTGAAVNGPAGCGKSVSILLCLGLFPQAVRHQNFPRIEGSHVQIVWQSSEAPKSGRTEDLWRTLMEDMDAITGDGRFAERLATKRSRVSASAALQEWLTVAKGHFLGLLHIDEIQNLFRLSAVARRRKLESGAAPPDLTVVEDETLRWLLAIMNAGIPLLVSGTPDGIEALSRRLSTLQRFTSTGSHLFLPFRNHEDKDYRRFMDNLSDYQFTVGKFDLDDEFLKHLFKLTAGVPRIIMSLWVLANRIALESSKDCLEPKHFDVAEAKFLVPLRPAVQALLNPVSVQQRHIDSALQVVGRAYRTSTP